ncbi:hypothetical protein A2291_04465 [candidate division WOR-1 bacterium RIFOXYB2_FULL_42_35]|uniref:DNA mismatch repair protein MutL n=1 Tax=candidate division WOR-1 bacterium RIFOXYC2_FULL_41_25 TaxID=1802586 RepID=A0A1F4TRJ3_UNCSA|nr:MAG: hypothetical protein A2247_07580 [candidate division WOR-1 bacterium RIFOXYA2_FULL_41_14]OGC25817.1 MAG: hypothetical protein A2291_04465 [candidate division WOR-1 bacterium RIFOXYB2_FULL_42_35]OGC35257.1 MAG: hypothetical protein A2462_08455 [candidate division WOR-1 bacterium RIFOXYC2_FULL_41_25]
MQSQIKILPEDLINKIAAGEVIERPASVVKELVENAIDAKATKISVEIQSAGRKLIRVSDNGQGMTKDEVKLAIERHSTSKINKLDDLFNIQSLGFRGEALPSIASVSRLEIRSGVRGEDAGMEVGTEMLVEGGKVEKLEEAGCPVGTTVSVKDLFFNTPARKKFLKSPATEMGHIGDIVTKYALVNPQIAFSLVSDGKPLFSSAGTGKLLDTIVSVYGAELAKGLIEINYSNVRGYVNKPNISRIGRDYMSFFVNGRYVKNFLLNRALEDAYRTLIPNNRHPIAVLFLEVNPKEVDVNVHPSKREVKFLKTNEAMEAVRSAAKTALSKILDNQGIGGSEREDQNTRSSEYQTGKQSWEPGMADVLFPPEEVFPADNSQLVTHNLVEMEVTSIQPYFPIYQFKNTYIIATDGEELVLIDQHAAQERIIYDQLSSTVASEPGSQVRLLPETIELDTKATIILQENLGYLKSLGFDLEEFGANSYLMRSVPASAVKSSAKQLVMDIIAELQSLGKSAQLETKQENIRKTIACKAAVKAGDKLSRAEMSGLIRDLYSTQNPLTCPHGRPTIIKITEDELKKHFKR